VKSARETKILTDASTCEEVGATTWLFMPLNQPITRYMQVNLPLVVEMAGQTEWGSVLEGAEELAQCYSSANKPVQVRYFVVQWSPSELLCSVWGMCSCGGNLLGIGNSLFYVVLDQP